MMNFDKLLKKLEKQARAVPDSYEWDMEQPIEPGDKDILIPGVGIKVDYDDVNHKDAKNIAKWIELATPDNILGLIIMIKTLRHKEGRK